MDRLNVFEDPSVIWITGAVLLTFAGVIYYQTVSRASFVAIVAIIVLVAAGTLMERLVVTPREEIQLTLTELAEIIEANDMPTALGYLAPSATETRGLVEDLMPMLDIKKARIISSIEVTLENSPEPKSATAKFRGLFQALHKSANLQGARPFDVEVELVFDGERWLIESYTSPDDFRRQANKLRR